MSENETKDSKFDLVTKEEIDEVFKPVDEERASGSRTPEHGLLMETVFALQLRVIQQRADAAFEERRLHAEFLGGDERLATRRDLRYAMRESDRRQELENYFHKRYREAKLVAPEAVGELMPGALEQMKKAFLSVFIEFSLERRDLLARVAELEAKQPGKMIIPEGPFEVVPAPKKED